MSSTACPRGGVSSEMCSSGAKLRIHAQGLREPPMGSGQSFWWAPYLLQSLNNFSKFNELVGCLLIPFIAKKRLRQYNEVACFILRKILRIFLITTMNRATFLQARWKFRENQVKVVVRICSLSASAAYSSNSIVSISI